MQANEKTAYRDFIRYAALKSKADPRLQQTLSKLPPIKWPGPIPIQPTRRWENEKLFDANRAHFRGLLWRAQKGFCAGCGEKMTLALSSLDHVQPLSRGGRNWIGNLLLMHRSCNTAKGDQSPDRSLREMLQAVNRWLTREAGSGIFEVPPAELP